MQELEKINIPLRMQMFCEYSPDEVENNLAIALADYHNKPDSIIQSALAIANGMIGYEG